MLHRQLVPGTQSGKGKAPAHTLPMGEALGTDFIVPLSHHNSHPHVTDGETEAQSSEGTCPRKCSRSGQGGLNPGSVAPEPAADH